MSDASPESGIFPKGFSTATEFAWPLVPAGSVVDLVYGDGLTEKTRSPGPIPVYGTNGRCGWHDTPLAKGPGVILGRKGMGNLGVEWCERDFWVIDTAYYVRPLTSDLDLKYFYYLVKYIGLNHLKDGTSNPSLTRDTFKRLLLPLPPRDEQSKIQQVLSLFDDKIDLNRRMSETLEAMARALFNGKAMIVCMSRRICIELYKKIIKLRPAWHSDKDEDGVLKVVMTGSASDGPEWQAHIRNKKAREELAKRFKKADDPLKLVIVRDMWLTGFDAPCMHTMYLDKPMRGHGLMQAIARVNRVFRDKPGGLVVDYLGLAAELKKALAEYTEQDRDNVGIPTEQALEVLLEKYEVVTAMFHGFDYLAFFMGKPSQRLGVLANATDFILTPQNKKESADERKQRFMQAATELSKAFALVATEDKAVEIREEVAFFQCIRAQLAKLSTGSGDGGKSDEDLDHAVRQIISRAVASDQVIDIFAAAGMQQPNIAILSDEFLAEVKGMPQRNLALEMLKKLLNDEIKAKAKKNLVQSRSFADMLEKTIRAYQNRSLDAAQVIAHLVQMAKDMREAHRRGEDLGLSDDELAFYDALEVNDSAVKVLGEPTLRDIAHELVESVRKSITIDWTVKDSVRARLRLLVKRILKKYGYPPDKQEKATLTVLAQAELLCKDWAA